MCYCARGPFLCPIFLPNSAPVRLQAIPWLLLDPQFWANATSFGASVIYMSSQAQSVGQVYDLWSLQDYFSVR